MLKIFNGDCIEVMKNLDSDCVDVVITSPPYNTTRRSNSEYHMQHHNARYDIMVESKTSEEYAQWVVEIFNELDRLLKKDGCIVWNVSYSSASSDSEFECVNSLWYSIASILKDTNFMIADKIVWKKKSALPNNTSPNKLTRICEDIFVFCRKSEYKNFKTNKKVKSVSRTGQKFYESIFNFIEAKNNDAPNNLNKATYSTELVLKLMDIYCREGSTVLDPFLGTGTTLNACKERGLDGIGIELSEAQCNFAKERLKIS